MTTTATELEAPLRALLDGRLDAIERVLLLAGVSRGERRNIVEEVETQFFELLARRSAGSPTRADVLAVLASLDPPEAYAPEGYRDRLAGLGAAGRDAGPRVPQPSLLAVGSAAGGVVTLLAGALLFLALQRNNGGDLTLLLAFVLFLVAPVAVTVGGILGIRSIRRSGGWLFGLPAAVFGAILFPLLLANLLLLFVMFELEELGLYAVVGLAFLAGNAYLVYQVWKAVSAGCPRAAPPEPR